MSAPPLSFSAPPKPTTEALGVKARARAAPWGADVVVGVGDGVGAPGAPPGPALQSSSKAKAAASSSRAKSAAKSRNNPPKHHSSQPQLHRPSSFRPGGGSGGMRKNPAEDSDDDQVRNGNSGLLMLP